MVETWTPDRPRRRVRQPGCLLVGAGLTALVACSLAGSAPPIGIGGALDAVAGTSAAGSAPPAMRPPAPSPTPPAAPARDAGPAPVPGGPAAAAAAGAAVAAATGYVRAVCPVDWRTPYGHRERAASAHLTAAAARTLRPDPRGRAVWTTQVLRSRLVVTCRVTAAQVVPEAPRSATRAHVAVLTDRRARRAGAPPAADRAEYVLLLVAVSGRWLVDRAVLGG